MYNPVFYLILARILPYVSSEFEEFLAFVQPPLP